MTDEEFAKLFPNVKWPQTFEGKNKTYIGGFGSLRGYQPDSREQMIDYINRTFYDDSREGNKYAERIASALDWSPVGLGHEVYNTTRAGAEGRIGDATLSAGLMIIPGPDGPVRTTVSKLRRGLEGVEHVPARSPFGSKPKPSDLAQENLEGPVIRKAEGDSIFDPPDRPQRPFKADYPNGAKHDASGKLLEDIEKRPLTAPNIAGRQTVDGPDVRIEPEAMEAIGEQLLGKKIRTVSPADMPDSLGETEFRIPPGEPTDMRISSTLNPDQRKKVIGHEVSHTFDEAVGQIPTKDLQDELRFVYSTTATGKENARPRVSPERDYAGDDIQRELMTEAIRSYAANPNWFKTVAPRTAARIREWVNTHPELSKIIQFNSLAAGAGGLALTGQSENSEAREMPREIRPQSNILKGTYSNFGPPIVPFELVNGATKASSYGIAKIAEALARRGPDSQTPSSGKFVPIARALLALQAKRKTPFYGGPR